MLFLWRTGYIQASRALMITSVVLGTFGLVSGLIGMQCSKAGGDNLALKGRIAGTGGVMFILQGIGKKKKHLYIYYLELFSPPRLLLMMMMIKECLPCVWPKRRFVHNDCSVLVRLQHNSGLF